MIAKGYKLKSVQERDAQGRDQRVGSSSSWGVMGGSTSSWSQGGDSAQSVANQGAFAIWS